MGIAERKAREKENLKALILEAAMKLFVEKGVEKTTIRNIADEINYSIGTVYVYFKDKNDIFHHLHARGFAQLVGEMKVLNSVSDPFERLKALGRIYIDFAMKNTDLYDLMFTMKAPLEFLDKNNKTEWNEGIATFGFLQDTVEACMQQGLFKKHQLEPLSYMIWGTVHGMCSLYNSGRVNGVCLNDTTDIVVKGYNEFITLLTE